MGRTDICDLSLFSFSFFPRPPRSFLLLSSLAALGAAPLPNNGLQRRDMGATSLLASPGLVCLASVALKHRPGPGLLFLFLRALLLLVLLLGAAGAAVAASFFFFSSPHCYLPRAYRCWCSMR